MPKLRRSAAVVAAALGVLGLISLPVSAATTTGGVTAGALAATRGQTQRINGVQLDWTPVAVKSVWTVGGLTVTTDPGESFAAGDQVKVTLVRSSSSCEFSATAAAAGTKVSLSQSAITTACGQVGFDSVRSVALSVTGNGLATSFTGNLGNLRGTLASFGGAVVNPQLTLKANAATTVASGVAYVGTVTVTVTGGSVTASSLAGTQALVQFYGSDTGKLFQYSGTISLDSSAAIRASGSGTAVTVSIDTAALAGTTRPKTSDVDSFSVAFNSPQHVGASVTGSAGAYAVSLVTGTIETPAPTAKWAVDAVNLDGRLSYQYSESETNENNSSLSFCHTFTVTNTSSSAVDWRVTFDTSLPPLWGFNPLSGGFRSAWGWDTVSYNATTHLWTIGGPSWARSLQSRQSVTAGYCVDNVPVPAVNPTTFSYDLRPNSVSSNWFVSLDLAVTSTSRWNVPWEITVDLADYVCAAGLQGRTVMWAPTVQVLSGRGSVYTLRGVTGWNSRYVSTPKPLSLSSVATYSPANGQYGSTCQTRVSRTVAVAATPAPSPSATAAPSPSAMPTPTATEPTATTPAPDEAAPVEEAPVESTPAATEAGSAPATPTSEPAVQRTPTPTPTATADTGATSAEAVVR